MQLQKFQDFFPLALGPDLSEAYAHAPNIKTYVFIFECIHICVKTLYISGSFSFVMKKSLQV